MKRDTLLWVFGGWMLIIFGTSVVSARQVDKNTVALWLFDEGAGPVVKDSSGNGNDGQVIEAEWVTGKFGGALQFDGIKGKDDYVEVPGSASLEITDAITIEAWVRMKVHQLDNIRIVCGYDAAVTIGYSLLLNNVGVISDYLNLGGWKQSTGKTQIPLGTWTHLAVTYDSKGGDLRLYVDGEVDLETKLAGEIGPRGRDPLYLARLNAGDPETPDGMIDEVRISNVARSQEEIQEAMNSLVLAVHPSQKLATTWGSIKNVR